MTDLPEVKLKALVNFPASATGRTGITVVRDGGRFFLDLDYEDFQITPTVSVDDMPNSYNLIWDTVKETFALVPFSLQATSGVSSLGAQTGEIDIDTTLLMTGSTLGADQTKLTGPGFPIYNGKITESHTSNAVTFALKTIAGSDASSINPAYIAFLQSDGSYLQRAITGALSVTISSGSTLGQNNGSAFQLAIIAIDNAGAVELAVASRLTATSAAGSGINGLYLNESLLYSTTAEGGAGAADSAATLYSTTARSNKSIVGLARADYDNGLVTAGLWAASPTRVILQRKGAGGLGLPASFFAHKNNTPQLNALHLAYTKVTFGFRRFSVGDFFDTTNHRWIPPPGLIEVSAAVWWQANFAQTGSASLPNASADAVAKIIKNGTVDIAAGEGHAPAGFPDTAAAFVPNVRDLANGTDYYELWAYSTSKNAANDVTIDGNPAHTYFNGSVIGG